MPAKNANNEKGPCSGFNKPDVFKGYVITRRLLVFEGKTQYFLAEKSGEKFLVSATFIQQGENKAEIMESFYKKHREKILPILNTAFDKTQNIRYDLRPYSRFGPLSAISSITNTYGIQIPFSSIVSELVSCIEYFHSLKFCGLDLSLQNVIIKSLNPFLLILKDANFSNGIINLNGEPPDEIFLKCRCKDFHALAVAILEIILMQTSRFSADYKVIAHSIASRQIGFPEEISAGQQTLLAGLLNDNAEKIWNIGDVKKWLRGEKIAGETPGKEPIKLKAAKHFKKSFAFSGNEYFAIDKLIEAFNETHDNWKNARTILENGEFVSWLKANHHKETLNELEIILKNYSSDYDGALFAMSERFLRPSQFTVFGFKITPATMYSCIEKLFLSTASEGEAEMVENIFNGYLLNLATRKIAAGATGHSHSYEWLKAMQRWNADFLDRTQRLGVAYNSLKSILQQLPESTAATGRGAKANGTFFERHVRKAVNECLRHAYSSYITPHGAMPNAETDDSASLAERVNVLKKMSADSSLIVSEEYIKLKSAYKIPAEIKLAVETGGIEAYIKAGRALNELAFENLLITERDVKTLLESVQCSKTDPGAYAAIETIAGYYKAAKCVKNSADWKYYDILAGSLKKLQSIDDCYEITQISNYAAVLLYKNAKWTETDKSIISKIANIKWNALKDELFKHFPQSPQKKGGAAVTFIMLAAILVYSYETSKYYILIFMAIFFINFVFIFLSKPEYKSVFESNRQRIEEVAAIFEDAPDRSRRMDKFKTAPGGQAQESAMLIEAVKNQNYNEAKKLLNAGANINERDASGASALIWAADRGDTRLIRLLTSHAADIEQKDNQGYAAIMWAAYNGHDAAIKMLIECGAAVNSRDTEGHTPLMAAACNGHSAAVTTLINAGADIKARDMEGQSALSYAKSSHNAETEKTLVEHIAPDKNGENKIYGITDFIFDNIVDNRIMDTIEIVKAAVTANKKTIKKIVNSLDSAGNSDENLVKAAARGDLNSVKKLIECGANPDANDKKGYTALIWAIDKAHDETALFLIEHGANVNRADNYGYTPLIWAADRGRENGARLLIERGADLNSTDNGGKTALIWAVIKKRYDMAKLLLNANADADIKDERGVSALCYAIDNNYGDFIELLAENKASLNIRTAKGFTALGWAVKNSNGAVLKIALESGVTIDERDFSSRTALMLAVISRNQDAVNALIKNNASLDLRDDRGRTALIHSVDMWHYEIARILIKAGADLNIADNYGKNALNYACDKNYESIIEMLAENGADLNRRDCYKSTPLIWAACNKKSRMVEYFISRGADFDITDANGNTALIHAAENGCMEIIHILCAHRANPELKNNRGKNAIEIARLRKHETAAQFLAGYMSNYSRRA